MKRANRESKKRQGDFLLSDKEIKAKFRPRFWAEPDRYYATEVLKQNGFVRSICSNCGKPFWSTNPDRKICGDPACGVRFDFIGNSPAGKRLEFLEVWKKFSEMFSKRGYTPIRRYPVVSRWNPTMEYTNASIAAFQPFVISGEVEPPANPLTIPQFCLRFSDIDNVGITGSHHTGFVMMGQHAFLPHEKWDQDALFEDIFVWLTEGIAIPKDELIFHEDAWAGGGDFGCCMEFFSRGCEIGNQVYMLYTQTATGYKDLPIKVLDMGSGQERTAWFSQGSATIYDATFPGVIRKLKNKIGFMIDEKFQSLIAPYRGMLNIDETEDINMMWRAVADAVGMDVVDLREQILPSAALYAIAEYSRTLLFALSDGAIPSNVGGGYNLRAIFRRALAFIDKYSWDITLNELCRWHAEELKEQYPELIESIDEVSKILDVEMKKYLVTKERSKAFALKLLEEGVTEEGLFKIYDSYGVTPETIKESAMKLGIDIKIPDNFYARVAEMHEHSQKATKTLEKEETLDLTGVSETKLLYFDDYTRTTFTARVLKIDGESVILDQTLFYGRSGGQEPDIGVLGGCRVYDVIKKGPYIIHKVEKPSFKVNDIVEGKIDLEHRIQLAQHHTAAHVINASSRTVLGSHVNQSGAYKDVEKGRLDITHYESLTDEQLTAIEKEANKIIAMAIPVESKFMSRREAEDTYGMRIYQGPAVPGKMLRIISMPGIDTEACGGTHVKNTSELQKIVITKSTKISDSIIRIEFKAGKAAFSEMNAEKTILSNICDILEVDPPDAVEATKELFEKWKRSVKQFKKLKDPNYLNRVKSGELKLESTELTKKYRKNIKVDDTEAARIVLEIIKILRTQPEHIDKTLKRFKDELEDNNKRIREFLAL